MIKRVILLLLGGYSPSRIHSLIWRDCADGIAKGLAGDSAPYVPSPLSFLDRWEVRNFNRSIK